MKSQTSIVAKQVRLQQWALDIKECQARPKDMNVETWCQEHGITKANYYYRLRCVRKAYLDQVREQSPNFVELSPPEIFEEVQASSKQGVDDCTPVAILRGPNDVIVELMSTASSDFLTALIGAFDHAK